MKNIKGITLLALVITIIVLLILASVATYSGLGVIKSSKFESFKTELKVMQTEVNKLYERYKSGETEILTWGTDLNSDASEILNEVGITDSAGYRLWNKAFIKNNLRIDIIDQDFLVNIEKRSVVSVNGFNYEEKRYRMLDELPDGFYNVEYEPQNIDPSNISFQVDYENKGNGIYSIKVSNITNAGYIDKWEVLYKEENEEDWKQSNDLEFLVGESGIYNIKLRKTILDTGEVIETESQVLNVDD